MVIRTFGTKKKGGKYRVNMVTIMDTKDGFEVNFSATSNPVGKQAELVLHYRNMIVKELELLNANLSLLKE